MKAEQSNKQRTLSNEHEVFSFFNRSGRRCGIVCKLNKQAVTGFVHNSSDCGQVRQISDLSTCPDCVGKVKALSTQAEARALQRKKQGQASGTPRRKVRAPVCGWVSACGHNRGC